MIRTALIRTGIVGLATSAVLATGVSLPADAASARSGAPVSSAAQTVAGAIPVTGTLADGSTFTGQITDLSTSVVNGVLMATGTLTGTGLPAGGTTFTTPIQNVATTGCSVLDLDLGAIHLDLLGLVVDLAPVHLDITAQPGSGQLLGNLLCAVTHLLDNNGGLSGISALLNRLLTGLGL